MAPRNSKPSKTTPITRGHSAHDMTFRQAMRHPSIYLAFFQQHLPKAITKRLVWNSIKLYKTNTVTDKQRHLYYDTVFEVQLIQDDNKSPATGFMAFIVEHFSSPKKAAVLKCRHYQLSLMLDLHNSHPQCAGQIPLVHVTMVYQGAGAYPHSGDLHDLVEAPASLIDQCLFQPLEIINVSDERFAPHRLPRSGLSVLFYVMRIVKARHPGEFAQIMRDLAGIMPSESDTLDDDILTFMIKYLLEHCQSAPNDRDSLMQVLHSLPEPIGDKIMSLAQMLREEGRNEGRNEGRLEGQLEGKRAGRLEGQLEGKRAGRLEGQQQERVAIARKLLFLNANIDTKMISQSTGLSIAEIEALREQ